MGGYPPYWPIIEAHISETMGKVIGLFIEDGVLGIENLSSVLKGIEPFIFSKDSTLLIQRKKIETYIKSVLEVYKTQDLSNKKKYPDQDYIYEKVTKYVYIRKNGHGMISCAFSINAQSSTVPKLEHAFSLGTSALKGTNFPPTTKLKEPSAFYNRHQKPSFFFKKMMPGGLNRKWDYRFIRKKPPSGETRGSYKAFEIDVAPHITVEEDPVQYAWGYSNPDLFPFCKSQVRNMRASGKFITSETTMLRLSKKFVYRLFFENGYPVNKPFVEYQTNPYDSMKYKDLECNVGVFYNKYEFILDEKDGDILKGSKIIINWNIL